MSRALLLSMLFALLLAGCAGSRINAQWSDPQFAGQPQRGAKVLVACQAGEPTLRRICADRMAAKLVGTGRGAGAGPGQQRCHRGRWHRTRRHCCRRHAAPGRWRCCAPSSRPRWWRSRPGPTIGIGIGGFGGSYRSGGGVGFGVSAPLGGAGPAETGYAATASLTDVASGRLMWSARASAPPSSDVDQQLSTLATLLLDAARQAGLFAA